jgi:serine/threonine protein phosphatase PrpC
MRSALLRGREHTKLGAVAACGEGPCAIALSRGGYEKGYSHRDPNEDAAGFALGPAGCLLAVADGHGGHEAAELAVAALLARFAAAWTEPGELAPGWPERARQALALLHAEIVQRGTGGGGNPEARTTLALALARPEEDLLAFASVGDSHVFLAAAARACDLAQGSGPPSFLGSPSLDPEELATRAAVGAGTLAGARALALATDGLSERGIGVDLPEAAVLDALARAERSSPGLRALETARGLVERALASHRRRRAGDNVAAAVLLLAGREESPGWAPP